MQGNLHVRFGERDDETDPSNEARRIIPTLQAWPRHAPGKKAAARLGRLLLSFTREGA